MDWSFVGSSATVKIKKYAIAVLIISIIFAFLRYAGPHVGINSWSQHPISVNIPSVIKLLGPAGLQGTLSPNTVYFLPVNIINSQSTDTGKNFQQLITFNAVPYQQIETDNLGNIRFYEGNTELYSWCESGCTSSATNATFWVKIPDGIPAQTTITIKITFEPSANSIINYDGVYAGEAPQLSPTYAEYDNGANVFGFYDNFVGVNNWYAINCGNQGALISQKLTLVTGSCSSGAMVIERNKYSPQVFEVLWTGQPQGGAIPLIGITNIAQITDIPTYKPWFFKGYSVQYTNGGLELAVTAPTPTGGTTKQNIGTLTPVPQISGSIVGIYWSGDGGLETVYLNNKPIATETDTSLNRQQFSDQYNFYIGVQTIGAQPVQPAPASSAGSGSGSASETYGYARLRYYPPDGVMPAADVGTQLGTLFGVNVNPEYIAANVGDTATFNGVAYGGTPPYTYQWYQMSESGNYQISSGPSLMLSPLGTQSSGTTTGRYYFYLTATDSNNIQQTSPDVALDIGTSCPTSLPEPNTIAFSFNNTGLKTPAPYQVNVTVDLSNYTMKTAPDLGNIRFYDGKTPLNSWCESGCFSATSGMWYADMTLLNTKLDSEPLGYMQQITFDPLQYAKYEATDLGNVRFYETSYGVLNAWCVSGCSSSSSSATFWVQIPTGISSAGTGSLVGMDIYFLPRAITFDSNSILTTLFGTLTTSLADFVNTIAQDTGALPSFPSQNVIAPTATICSTVNPVTRSMINPQNWQYLNFSPPAFFWIKLPDGIAADTNITINMTFIPNTTEYDGKIAGEAPYFSKQYGRYDNGKNVFDLYFNKNDKEFSLLYPQSGDTPGGVYTSGNNVVSTVGAGEISGISIDGNPEAFGYGGGYTLTSSAPGNQSVISTSVSYPFGEKYTGIGTIPLSGIVESLSQSNVTFPDSAPEYSGDGVYECVPFAGLKTTPYPLSLLGGGVPNSDGLGGLLPTIFIGNIPDYYQTFANPYEVIAPLADYGSGRQVPGSNCNLQNYTVNGSVGAHTYSYSFPTTDLFGEQSVGAIRTGIGNSSYGALVSLTDGTTYGDTEIKGDTPSNWTYAAMTYSASAPPDSAVVNASDFEGGSVGSSQYPLEWYSTVNLIQGPGGGGSAINPTSLISSGDLDQWNIRMSPLEANDPANYPVPDPYDNFSSTSDAHIIVGQVGFPGQNTTYNWVRVRSVIPGVTNATPTCAAPSDTGTGAGTGVVPMAKAVIKAAAVPSAATGSSSCVNVLLVTIGITPSSPGYAAYNSALSGYEALLTQRSLTWNYIVLDNYASSQGIALDPGNWISVKGEINQLERIIKPQYLIILGGNGIIPMPDIYSTPSSYSVSRHILTDDPYGTLAVWKPNAKVNPSVIVSRFPGDDATTIALMLQSSIKGRNNNNVLISTALGKQFYTDEADPTSLLVAGAVCSQNPNCLLSPPYCLKSDENSCTGSSIFLTDLNSYGIQLIACHGDGYACYQYSPTTQKHTNVQIEVNFTQNYWTNGPIVFMGSCYAGVITKQDSGYGHPIVGFKPPTFPYPPNQQTLAQSALEYGAGAYLGVTSIAYSNYDTAGFAGIYVPFKNKGKTLGQAFLAYKNAGITSESDIYAYGSPSTLQLYGDPTQSYSNISGTFTQPQPNVAQPFTQASSSPIVQTCLGPQCSGGNSASLCGGMTANVDIVTMGITNSTPGYAAYNSALSGYEQKLTNENLTYNYTELGSFAAAQNMTLDPTSWTSVRAVINQLENLTNPQYLIILGGTDVVPMPNLVMDEKYPPLYPDGAWGTLNIPGDTQNIIYTDIPYGNLTANDSPSNNIFMPTIIVARFPGSSAEEIAGMLRNSTLGPRNNRAMVSVVEDFKEYTEEVMGNDVFNGGSCNNAINCFSAPPYCLYSQTPSGCTGAAVLTTAINLDGLQVYNCHGNGFACGNGHLNGYTIQVFNSNVLPQLPSHPIIMMLGCFDGNIDTHLIYTNNNVIVKPLALTAMDNGASAYIGSTKVGSGFEISQHAEIYNDFKNGEALGEAFLNMQQDWIKRFGKSYSKYPIVSNTPPSIDENVITNMREDYSDGSIVAEESVLYGDPTVSYSGTSGSGTSSPKLAIAAGALNTAPGIFSTPTMNANLDTTSTCTDTSCSLC